MIRVSSAAVWAALICLAATIAVRTNVEAQGNKPKPSSSGWTLAPDAESRANPLAGDAKVLATGKTIYKDKCAKCHGPSGLGDGPDADPDHRAHMDLTNPKHAGDNPDGVVFDKVSNGRRRPKMPVFKEELTEQQIWSVVTYVQSLRKK